jgi:hypothetical protein
MTDTASTRLPDQHAEIVAMLRTYAANAPESLQECIDKALDDYQESGAWEADDLSLYE